MKKLLLFVVAAVTIGSTSCKKDWVCECTDSTTGSTTEFQIPNSRRPEASVSCDFYEGFGEDCSLK